MIIYRISNALLERDPRHSTTSFHGTLTDAHTAAKLRFATTSRSHARIDHLEIPAHKAAIVDLMNSGADSVANGIAPAETWGLTERGGLRKLGVGE